MVIKEDRGENVLTNDGMTMKTLAESYNHESEHSESNAAVKGASMMEDSKDENTDVHVRTIEPASQASTGGGDADAPRTSQDDSMLTEEEIAAKEERRKKKERDVRAEKKATEAAEKHAGALSLKEMQERGRIKFEDRPTGIGKNTGTYTWTVENAKGASQVVTYSSRFVDKLSDITDDMNISGGLSIKYGTIGGSGRGAFIDSDKFKESDLNYYISVKVINQTINIKDALEFNHIPNVLPVDFTKVYGDCFISGFLEGGEFNALISMKVLNKAKKTEIQAEAKVALTAGTVELSAEANVNIAKTNISTNTETTIQVSWSGGGHIKHPSQQWTIESLTEAAARFPDLVAHAPQRTYAILTKYDSLRSYLSRTQTKVSPLNYENATLYTNALMDSFMTYKTLYKRMQVEIFDIRNGTKQFHKLNTLPAAPAVLTEEEKGALSKAKVPENFPPSIKGLDAARKVALKQMSHIVNEVDAITGDPTIPSKDDHVESFISPVLFESLLPVVEPIPATKKSETPLTGQVMGPPAPDATGTQTDAGATVQLLSKATGLSLEETNKAAALMRDRINIADHFRLEPPVGDESAGQFFCNLDFVQPNFVISSVSASMAFGAIAFITVTYTNGLILSKGNSQAAEPNDIVKLTGLGTTERIVAGSVEVGTEVDPPKGKRVISLKLFTNRGRSLIVDAKKKTLLEGTKKRLDDVDYGDISVSSWDTPLGNGSLRGFWGRSVDNPGSEAIHRLGFIWGDLNPVSYFGFPKTFALFLIDRQQIGVEGTSEMSGLASMSNPGEDGYILANAAGNNYTPTPGCSISPQVKFKGKYSKPPRLITGINFIDAEVNVAPNIITDIENLTTKGFNARLTAIGLTKCVNFGLNWMVLPDNGIHMLHGQVSTDGVKRNLTDAVYIRVYFSKPFAEPPIVRCWFKATDFGSPRTDFYSLKTYPMNVDAESFTVVIETWANRTFQSASVGWFAYDQKAHGIQIKSDTTTRSRSPDEALTFKWNNNPFSTMNPSVFIAFSEIDTNGQTWSKIRAERTSVSSDEVGFAFGTWDRNVADFHHIIASYIVME